MSALVPRHKLLWWPAVLIASALLVPSQATAQALYQITDLGTVPGASGSVAAGINDNGDVVGYTVQDASFPQVALVWRGGTVTNLGRLAGGNYSTASAINNFGVVVGDGDTGNYRPQSWVSRPTGLFNFFPNNGGNTHALFVTDSGAIGGYYTKSLSGAPSAWRGSIWTPDPKDPTRYRQVNLPILVGLDPTSKGTTALPMAFNQSGQAAGYAMNEVIGQHACFWNNDGAHSIVDLGVYQNDGSSLAWGMNDNGDVVGESHPPYSSRPVIWLSGAAHTAVELPVLPGDNYGSANAINTLGHILGQSAQSQPGTSNVGPRRLVLWRDGQVYELSSVLDSSGLGWSLTSANAINNHGQIVGLGVHNGQSTAFLMTPLSP